MVKKILSKSSNYVLRNIEDFEHDQKRLDKEMDDFDKDLRESISKSRFIRNK